MGASSRNGGLTPVQAFEQVGQSLHLRAAGGDYDVLLPPGYKIDPFIHTLTVALSKHKLNKVVLSCRQAGKQSQIYPPWSKTVSLDGFGRLSIEVVADNVLLEAGNCFLDEHHHVGRARRGTMLIGKAEGAIACVAVMDEVRHAVPAGRTVALSGLLKQGWRERLFNREAAKSDQHLDAGEKLLLRRRELVRTYGITCGTRFATHPDFRRCGIGQQMAMLVRDVAYHYRAPVSQRIEVLRRVTRGEWLAELGGEKENFLTKAGFHACDYDGSLNAGLHPRRRMDTIVTAYYLHRREGF